MARISVSFKTVLLPSFEGHPMEEVRGRIKHGLLQL